MKFVQNNKIGVLLEDGDFTVSNVLRISHFDEPDNPVAIGFETTIVSPPGLVWTVFNSNISMHGVGTGVVLLPRGDYEIASNTQ
jgi:hypothetical protein